jgi:hypothetical protein
VNIALYEHVENKIITLRGQQVLIDSDIAELYGVETKRINEAVSRNPNKFPDGYLIELSQSEWETVKSQIATSPNPLGGGKVRAPKAFTEKGLYMLATILKSPKATETTLAIIDTFAKVREIGRTVKRLSELPEGSERQKSLMHRAGELISDLIQPDEMVHSESEASVELNLAIVKFKYTTKKKGK